jgi:hypothetical protein
MPDGAVETDSSGFFDAPPALPLADCLTSGLNKRFRQASAPAPGTVGDQPRPSLGKYYQTFSSFRPIYGLIF